MFGIRNGIEDMESLEDERGGCATYDNMGCVWVDVSGCGSGCVERGN